MYWQAEDHKKIQNIANKFTLTGVRAHPCHLVRCSVILRKELIDAHCRVRYLLASQSRSSDKPTSFKARLGLSRRVSRKVMPRNTPTQGQQVSPPSASRCLGAFCNSFRICIALCQRRSCSQCSQDIMPVCIASDAEKFSSGHNTKHRLGDVVPRLPSRQRDTDAPIFDPLSENGTPCLAAQLLRLHHEKIGHTHSNS